jgi:hypothetical protein
MIESNSALINGYRDHKGNHALARIDQTLSGCGAQIRLINMGKCGCYWLCHREDDPRNDYILLLPHERWEQDARDAGFTLVQKLNQRSP